MSSDKQPYTIEQRVNNISWNVKELLKVQQLCLVQLESIAKSLADSQRNPF